MRIMISLTTMMLLYTFSASPIWAAERVITAKDIARGQGQVKILMPCNWQPGSEKPVGKYAAPDSLFEPREMPNTTLERQDEGPNRYLVMTVGDADRTGLNEVSIQYRETNQQCPDGQWGTLTR